MLVSVALNEEGLVFTSVNMRLSSETCAQNCGSPVFLPVVTGNVINPEGVADILFTLLLVLAEPRQDMDLIELRVNGGSLSKTRHWHCEQVKKK